MKPFLSLLLAVLLVIPAFGQMGTRLEAEIPFGFEFSGAYLPAGTYHITLGSPSNIRNVEPRLGAVLFSVPPWTNNTPGKPARLVFNKYGDRHFLSQMYTFANYYQFPKSKAERELVTSRVIAGRPNLDVIVVTLRVVR